MDNKEVLRLLYHKKIGEKVRELLETLCSPDLDENYNTIDELYKLIQNTDRFLWPVFVEFLYTQIPDLLKYFSVLHFGFFKSCEFLTRIVIPKNVKEIKSECFSECTNLVYVGFEEGSLLDTLHNCAFETCENLHVLDLSNTQITKLEDQDIINKNLTQIILPNTVKKLCWGSLACCSIVGFPNINSIKDLELEIDKDALQDAYTWTNKVVVKTKTDKDKIIKEYYTTGAELGPKLAKNEKIKIGDLY